MKHMNELSESDLQLASQDLQQLKSTLESAIVGQTSLIT